jgi:hypothetical protein
MFLSVTPVASLNSQTVKTEPSIVQWNGTYGGTSEDIARAFLCSGKQVVLHGPLHKL